MYKLFIIFLISGLLISCGKSLKSRTEDFTSQFCNEWKSVLTLKSIAEAEKSYRTNFKTEINEQSADLSNLHSLISDCLSSAKLNKELLHNSAQGITGNGNDYYELTEDKIVLRIAYAEKPYISTRLKFRTKHKITDTNDISLNITLRLLDQNRQATQEYELYYTPDFIRTLKKGSGDFEFLPMLDILWNRDSRNPFRDAAELMKRIESSVYYELNITVKNKEIRKEEQKQDKEYQEMIDEIKFN